MNPDVTWSACLPVCGCLIISVALLMMLSQCLWMFAMTSVFVKLITVFGLSGVHLGMVKDQQLLTQKPDWAPSNSCSCQWSETMSLNCGHKWAYCSSPRWYMSMESQSEIKRENWRTRRETCPSNALPSANPHGLTQTQTWAYAGRGRWLTAWAMAWLGTMNRQ
jgi:hypothetical protein